MYCEGNRVATADPRRDRFDALATEAEALGPGENLFFTDWRGDPDERMRDGGPTIRELFCPPAEHGAVVKGLGWRSYQNQHLDEAIERAGGEVLLDQRVRIGGSHHQKFVVIRHPGEPERDVAFAGGIHLCHSRRDDASHRGDPQAMQMSKRLRGSHSVARRAAAAAGSGGRGPRRHLPGALDDPAPLDTLNPVAWVVDRLRGADLTADRLPEQPPDPSPCGPHAVQVRRTYPDAHYTYDLAPHGERSVARGYTKAVKRARRLIYLEDQYRWSKQVAGLFAKALSDNPGLHLIAVIPRYPDVDGRLALPPNPVERRQAVEACQAASPDRRPTTEADARPGEWVPGRRAGFGHTASNAWPGSPVCGRCRCTG